MEIKSSDSHFSNRQFLSHIKQQLNVDLISNIKNIFLNDKTFDNYINFHSTMTFIIKKIDFNEKKLNQMKRFNLFLTDENNTIIYFCSVTVNKYTKSFSTDLYDKDHLLINYLNYLNISNDENNSNDESNQILNNEILNRKLNFIQKLKSQEWEEYSIYNRLFMSRYTPATITISISDGLSFEISDQSSDFIVPSIIDNGTYTGIVFNSGSATLTFTGSVPDNVSFLSVAGGGGPCEEIPSTGGGGGGYILNPITDEYPTFSDYLSSIISNNDSISLSIGKGGQTHGNGENTVFGNYISYGGCAGIEDSGGIGGGNNIDTTSNGGNGGNNSNGNNSNIISTIIPFYIDSTTIYISGGGAGCEFPETQNNTGSTNEPIDSGNSGDPTDTDGPSEDELQYASNATGGTGSGGIVTYYDISNGDQVKIYDENINGSYIVNSYGGGAGSSNGNGEIYYNGTFYGDSYYGTGGNGVIMMWWSD